MAHHGLKGMTGAKFWGRVNTGRPVPGPRFDGQFKTVAFRDNYPFFHGHVTKASPSTADRALVAAEAEASPSAERMREERKSAREKGVRRYKLLYNVKKLGNFYNYDYRKQQILLTQYFAGRGAKNGNLNQSVVMDRWSMRTSRQMMFYHTRREHAATLGKDPVKIEEGSVKFGRTGRGKYKVDPFLRLGPATQLRPTSGLHNNEYKTSGWHYLPPGVDKDLGRYAARRQVNLQLRKLVERRGKDRFFDEIGSLSTAYTGAQNWYHDLLNQPTPRLGKFPGSRGAMQMAILATRHHREVVPRRLQPTLPPPPAWSTHATPGPSVSSSRDLEVRLQRPDYC
eukprot:TRINITY_DN40478_c0_g1_i1.p1 TRINITY_DN40478_c0_g1~~TRINITY_DN40478_c0_g1_i1.p1  ORF type:complete len:371 (+),score=118.12 TRINITY_DN40478_c0_g1_i1:96-1115(+)